MNKRLNFLLLTAAGLILGAALLLAARLGASAAPVDARALDAANRLFEADRYAESARVLEQLLAQEAEDSAVLYNLGNAFYAQGDLPSAVEYYERAARLAPRDADIRHNLDLARSQSPPVAGEEGAGAAQSLARLTGEWFNVNETALLLLGLWFAASYFLFASGQVSRPSARSALLIAAATGVFLVVVVGASLGSRIYLDRTVSQGVELPAVIAQSQTR